MTAPPERRSGRVGLGIRGRLILWFVLGAVGAVVVGSVVVYVSGLATIQGTLGTTYCQIASRVVGQLEDRFAAVSATVSGIATDVLTTEVAMEENDLYRNRSQAWMVARLKRLVDEWRRLDSGGKRLKMLHPQLSYRLSVLAGLDASVIRRLTLYDRRGLAIAANRPPPSRDGRASKWFKAVSTQDSHFTYVDLDKESGGLILVVPVWGGVDVAGFVVAEYDYARFAEEVENVRFGDTGEASVVDYAGVPLTGAARGFLIQALARRPPGIGDVGRAGGGAPYWVALTREGPWPFWQRLACVAPAAGINALRNRFDRPPWAVVVTQAPGESYAVLGRSIGSFALSGIVGIIVVGLGGAILAWHIAAPLKELQQGVRRFARGERDRQVTVSSTDEIGELAAEFNRMAERVAASETELRAFAEAVENAADAIFMCRPDGVIYYVNPAFEVVTGYAADDIRGETPAVLRSARTPPPTDADMWRGIEAGRAWRGELWHRRRDGVDYPVDLTISPIRDDSGAAASLLGIHRDITLARQYQESLETEVAARTREIAETQGLTAMGEMASMIAHDLRNALSTVKMNLQILFRRHSTPGDGEQEYCQIGLEQVAYMEEILRDMLSYARPERLRADWHDMAPIVDDALAMVAQGETENGITFSRQDGKGLPKVYCDRVRIVEVLGNLVDNAMQAMPDGGSVEIQTHLLIDASAPMVQVSVQDSGIGIPEDARAQVFEPFFTTRSKGTGLGLTIVRRIVEEHGGSIRIDPRQGRGTSVIFTLPTVPSDP